MFNIALVCFLKRTWWLLSSRAVVALTLLRFKTIHLCCLTWALFQLDVKQYEDITSKPQCNYVFTVVKKTMLLFPERNWQ